MAVTSVSAARPWELVLMARAARLYYLDNVSKVDIAETLGVSRFRVARLLESARSSGMVQIEIGWPGVLDAPLSAELCSAYGLGHALVLDIPDDDDAELRQRLGEAMGDLLRDIVTPDDVLGMAWARSLMSIPGSLRGIAKVPVVQLTGALSARDGGDVLDLVRQVARASGGPAHYYYAPLMVADARTAAAIRRQPDVAAAMAMVPTVTVGVVGVGCWAAGLSTCFDALPRAEQKAAADQGVIADVSGVLLNADGRPVPTPLHQRMLITDAASLARIPTVLACAYGVAKTPAVLAAIRGGYVNGLVTHSSLARSLLAAAEQPPLRRARTSP